MRYLAIIAVAGLCATTLATFGIAIAKTFKLLDSLLNGKWRDELIVVSVLEAVDVYLLAIVQLIVVVGLYELARCSGPHGACPHEQDPRHSGASGGRVR